MVRMKKALQNTVYLQTITNTIKSISSARIDEKCDAKH